MERKYFVGTMGWAKGWGEQFYPKGSKRDQLEYLSREFATVEINSTFYRLPRKEVFAGWRKKTPKSFVFAVKMNQYITHRKRLIIDEDSSRYLKYFVQNAKALDKKFAVILVQLPPSFKQNLERLEIFLKAYDREIKRTKLPIKTALEFRHPSWFDQGVFSLLKKYRVALVLVDYPEALSKNVVLSNFVYARLYGDEKPHHKKYLERKLQSWAEKFQRHPSSIKKTYVFFSEDYSGYAIDNARYLLNQLKPRNK